MKRPLIGALLWVASSALVWAQTRTIDNKNCHMTVPANWKQLGPSSAEGPGGWMGVVRSITPDDVQMTKDMIKQGQMASMNAKVVDENSKRVLIQSERKGANGKTTTHYQVMTKTNPGCQGSVDFDSPSDAAAARKIVETTTGAQ